MFAAIVAAALLSVPPWNVEKVDAPEAWTVTSGEGVQVAVIDTCVDLDHPALEGRYVAGWDYVDGDPDPDCGAGDTSDHGTHVAGIVAAVAPGAELIVARTVEADGHGDATDAMTAAGWAATQGADVVNLSQGAHQLTDPGWAAVMNAHPDVTFVAGAGNGAYNQDAPLAVPFMPAQANAANLVSVAASTQTDTRATFSNYGARQVDLAAPGVSIWSTMPGGGYGFMQGTSMAAPHVAGVAALVQSRYGLDGAGVRDQLLSAADPLTGWTLAGRVNASRAVSELYRVAWPNDPWVYVPRECGDGLDNDGDGKTDMADYGCTGGMTDPSERDPVTITGGVAVTVEGGTLAVPVTLSNPVPYTVTVGWRTVEDPANGLVAGVDYLSAAGTLTFAPGVTVAYVTVPTLEDEAAEAGTLYGHEWLLVALSSPVGGVLPRGMFGPVAHGFIADND